MDDNQYIELSRRSLIKSGIRALAGIAIVSLTVTKTLAAETKPQSQPCNTRTSGSSEVRTAMIAFNSYPARQQMPWEPAR